jgi:hypothetical protein
MHGGGAAHDQLQKRISELEARLNKSEVRSAVCALQQQLPVPQLCEWQLCSPAGERVQHGNINGMMLHTLQRALEW